ncbi:MAG: myo-inosose-2 dehydratase, partial [Dehalococcoidia bacterium]
MRIGVSPLLWSNDDLPRLGENVPLVRMLTQAASAGYEGVELGHKFPRDPDRLRAALGPLGLSLASGWYGARLL